MLDAALLPTLFGDFDVDVERARFIRYSQNYAYESTRHGQPVVMRIARDRHLKPSQVDAEQEWVTYLADRGIDVCRPVRSNAGRWCESRQLDGSQFASVCLQRVPGRKMTEEEKTLEMNHKLGQLTAQLHDATLAYARNRSRVDRPQWFESRLLTEDLNRYVPESSAAFHGQVNSIVGELKSIPVKPDGYGLIHADISFGNCNIDNGRLWIFDFDNCEYGHFVNDIATMLYDSIYCALFNRMSRPQLENEVIARWKAFLDGYETVRNLGPIEPDVLRKFLVLREAVIYVHYQRVMTPERKAQLHEGLEFMRRNVEAGVTDVPLG